MGHLTQSRARGESRWDSTTDWGGKRDGAREKPDAYREPASTADAQSALIKERENLTDKLPPSRKRPPALALANRLNRLGSDDVIVQISLLLRQEKCRKEQARLAFGDPLAIHLNKNLPFVVRAQAAEHSEPTSGGQTESETFECRVRISELLMPALEANCRMVPALANPDPKAGRILCWNLQDAIR